jgi:pyruvate, water dikinase
MISQDLNIQLSKITREYGFNALSSEIEAAFNALPEEIMQSHWKWRLEMATALSNSDFLENKNITAIYLLGSVKNAQSGPASDIDMMIHTNPDNPFLDEIKQFMKCWGLCLSELNAFLTGEKIDEMLDIHFISDKDIAEKNSFTSMIGSHFNSAKLIKSFGR